jgi:hypothetical protein
MTLNKKFNVYFFNNLIHFEVYLLYIIIYRTNNPSISLSSCRNA